MLDLNFPVIEYTAGESLKTSGEKHGEEFRESIKELAQIREELMLNKNPDLKPHLERLALEQWEINKKYLPNTALEMEGICQGANVSMKDIVVLNNYTDFRDIQLPNEGCSTIYLNDNELNYSGQTWDMHRSAQRFLCLIHVKPSKEEPDYEMLILSLVGCLGLMGVNQYGQLIGVNNINTEDARPGVIWPALIRDVLKSKSFDETERRLTNLPVTSGHNYIISGPDQGAHYEITPTVTDLIGKNNQEKPGFTFHTNHCLGENVKKIESKLAQNSTTFVREDLLNKHIPNIKSFDDFIGLFKSHDNYPQSICSHYESGAQDPSFTCGAGAIDYTSNELLFWRGCQEYSQNYVEHAYHLDMGVGFNKK